MTAQTGASTEHPSRTEELLSASRDVTRLYQEGLIAEQYAERGTRQRPPQLPSAADGDGRDPAPHPELADRSPAGDGSDRRNSCPGVRGDEFIHLPPRREAPAAGGAARVAASRPWTIGKRAPSGCPAVLRSGRAVIFNRRTRSTSLKDVMAMGEAEFSDTVALQRQAGLAYSRPTPSTPRYASGYAAGCHRHHPGTRRQIRLPRSKQVALSRLRRPGRDRHRERAAVQELQKGTRELSAVEELFALTRSAGRRDPPLASPRPDHDREPRGAAGRSGWRSDQRVWRRHPEVPAPGQSPDGRGARRGAARGPDLLGEGATARRPWPRAGPVPDIGDAEAFSAIRIRAVLLQRAIARSWPCPSCQNRGSSVC